MIQKINTNYSYMNKNEEKKENFISKNFDNSKNEMQNNQHKSWNNSLDILSKNTNSNLKTLIYKREITDYMKKQNNIVNSNKKINIDLDFFEIPNKNVKIDDNNFLPECIKENKINSFYSLGIYYIYHENFQDKIYFDIFFRKIKITDDNYVDDIFFNDVTDLIKYKQIIIDENIKKQNVLAKIAHEFKTPLNSVIGITSNIKDSDEMLSKFTSNKLDVIQNLSNYLIFLVSDIIQFSSLNDISYINLNLSTLDLKEILNFCFQILNSLLTLNNRKNKNITSELRADKIIEFLIIESDEIRIKQILLNFISNSVKFTNEGSIIVKAKTKVLNGKNVLKISVKDTGIGIRERDKESLFKEFQPIEDGKHLNRLNNTFGSGLGLSICKVLSKKLDINLMVKSEYTKGSTFSIFIPINNQDINYSIIDMNSKNFEEKNNIKLITNDQSTNYNKNNNIVETLNIKEIDINTSLLNENNVKINDKNIINLKENIDLDSSSTITKIRSEIVPLNDIEDMNFYYNNKHKNSSEKLDFINNGNSSSSNSNIGLRIISNANTRGNSNLNLNNSITSITKTLINNRNCQNDYYRNSNALSRFNQENNYLRKYPDSKYGNIDNHNVFEFFHIIII